MKRIHIALFCLLMLGLSQQIEARQDACPAEFFAEDDEMLTLDNEIDELLEEDLEETDILKNTSEDASTKEPQKLPKHQKQDQQLSSARIIHQVPVKEIDAESIAVEVDKVLAEDQELVLSPPTKLDAFTQEATKSIKEIEINLKQVFSGSPIIYSLLFLLSTVSVCVWLYSMLTIRSIEFLPPQLIKDLRAKLVSNQFDEALDICVKQKHFFCKMLASGILARKHGLSVMIDTMKAEGKRTTVPFWQRISVLNEIAIIAPMLGLLGTVLGMFYAFYDLNRSVESVSLLFDGLGISVGTTVGGLVVAILSMILYTISKYRLVRILASVENEAQTFAALIDTRHPNYLEK